MTGDMKFYLLAEEGGWNCSSIAHSYTEFLNNSKAYQIIIENIPVVEKHISHRAKSILDAYNEITLKPETVKDCFILENAINYVALHSYEEYYLNPLTIDPNYSGNITSIGQLIFDYKGKEVPLNDIILDETTSNEEKKDYVYAQLEYYLDDIDDLVYSSLEETKKEIETNKSNSILSLTFEVILTILLNVILFIMFIYHYDGANYFIYHFEKDKTMSYFYLLYSSSLLLYDITFAIYHSYKAKILEPYNYAKRFLKKNSDKVFDDLYQSKDKLFNYITGAINEKIILQNDIKDFSKLSSSYIDFQAVLNSSKLKSKKTYKVLKSIDITFLTLTSLISIISLIMYIISIIFQTSF